MTNQKTYQPPYTITSTILNLVAEISEMIGRLSVQEANASVLRLRRINRIRTIQGSLAIEGNTLSEEQITAILEGKRVIAPPREFKKRAMPSTLMTCSPNGNPRLNRIC